MIFEIFPWKDGKHWGLRLKGRNGEVVMHSEGYVTAGNARRAAKDIKREVQQAPIVEEKR